MRLWGCFHPKLCQEMPLNNAKVDSDGKSSDSPETGKGRREGERGMKMKTGKERKEKKVRKKTRKCGRKKKRRAGFSMMDVIGFIMGKKSFLSLSLDNIEDGSRAFCYICTR